MLTCSHFKDKISVSGTFGYRWLVYSIFGFASLKVFIFVHILNPIWEVLNIKLKWLDFLFFSYQRIIDLQSKNNNSHIMNGKPLNVMLIPTKNFNYNIRNTDKIALFYTKHNFFQTKKFFYPLLFNGKS